VNESADVGLYCAKKVASAAPLNFEVAAIHANYYAIGLAVCAWVPSGYLSSDFDSHLISLSSDLLQSYRGQKG
jgi:hypothetical protein